MHFSIPDTQDCSDTNGPSYVGYNIHINGLYHCTVRYRQLYSLNDQLRKHYGYENIPQFPPKKFWPLSYSQLEERRTQLEKYIQGVGQNLSLLHSEYFNTFLLTAQQESSGEKVLSVTLDVYKMNGYRIPVNVYSNEPSDLVLEKVCQQINLPKEYVYYFSLCITKKDESGEFTIVRKLQNFESPYISLKTIGGNHKITLRKSCWDPDYDLELMEDRVSLDLVYIQTVSDIERGWALCHRDTHSQLATLQATGSKHQYLKLARTLKYYGFIQFKDCIADYPLPDSKVTISAGHRQLNLRFLSTKGELREVPFKVTRMKCWRITTHNDVGDKEENGEEEEEDKKSEVQLFGSQRLELSFEYLMTRDNLQWVTISSEQAILMSVCLQSIVDELLMQKAGAAMRRPSDCVSNGKGGSFCYMNRDGSSQMISLSQSSSSSDTFSRSSSGSRSPTLDASISMRRLSEKLARAYQEPLVENDAFEGIGDDDL